MSVVVVAGWPKLEIHCLDRLAPNRYRAISVAETESIAGHITFVSYGHAGDGGEAVAADLSYSTGIAIDAEGNFSIADLGNNRVRKVDQDEIITTGQRKQLEAGPAKVEQMLAVQSDGY